MLFLLLVDAAMFGLVRATSPSPSSLCIIPFICFCTFVDLAMFHQRLKSLSDCLLIPLVQNGWIRVEEERGG